MEKIKFKYIKNKVFFIQSENDPTVLIGVELQIFDGYISWHDTIKERIKRIKRIIENTSENFIFETKDENGMTEGTYKIQILTWKLYQKKVLPNLCFDPKIKNEKVLHKFFISYTE